MGLTLNVYTSKDRHQSVTFPNLHPSYLIRALFNLRHKQDAAKEISPEDAGRVVYQHKGNIEFHIDKVENSKNYERKLNLKFASCRWEKGELMHATIDMNQKDFTYHGKVHLKHKKKVSPKAFDQWMQALKDENTRLEPKDLSSESESQPNQSSESSSYDISAAELSASSEVASDASGRIAPPSSPVKKKPERKNAQKRRKKPETVEVEAESEAESIHSEEVQADTEVALEPAPALETTLDTQIHAVEQPQKAVAKDDKNLPVKPLSLAVEDAARMQSRALIGKRTSKRGSTVETEAIFTPATAEELAIVESPTRDALPAEQPAKKQKSPRQVARRLKPISPRSWQSMLMVSAGVALATFGAIFGLSQLGLLAASSALQLGMIWSAVSFVAAGALQWTRELYLKQSFSMMRMSDTDIGMAKTLSQLPDSEWQSVKHGFAAQKSVLHQFQSCLRPNDYQRGYYAGVGLARAEPDFDVVAIDKGRVKPG